jgi:uncharacterized repeat protein (TIGR01451 family)
VTFFDNGTPIASNVAVNGSAQATAQVTFSTEGIHPITAQFNGSGGFAASQLSNTVDETTLNHASKTVNGDGSITYCNGPIAIQSDSGGNPYPSFMAIPANDLPGVIQQLKLSLNNLQTQDPQALGFGLASPGGTTVFEFMSWAGGVTNSVGGGLNINFADSGSGTIPETSTPNCPAATPCLPTDNANQVGPASVDNFPSPAPSLVDKAAPTGSSTFATEFGGLGGSSVNGNWALYLSNRHSQAGNLGSLGSWCMTFTMQQGAHPTMTTVTGTPNPVLTTGTANLTATVAVTDGSGIPVSTGTVSFVDGSTNLGNAAVNNGVATLTGVVLAERTHHIVASYNGSNGSPSFGISSGHFNIRSDNPTTISGGGPYSYCNTGSISVPGLNADVGAAAPYPSNIFVTNLPGTVKGVTVSLKQFSTNDQNDLLSLLVGPGSGSNLDFFSLTGNVCGGAACAGTFGPVNLTFDDTAASTVTGDVSSGGTFRPTSLNASGVGVSPDAPVAYPACPPNATDCSSPPVGPPLSSNPFTPTHKATTAGTGILGNTNSAGVFGGTSASTTIGNGTYSLYLDDANHGAGRFSTIAGGWCLSFTENQVAVAVTEGHTGSNPSNHFVQGEQGAQFTVAIKNNGVNGAGSTGDPDGNHPLTVTDTLNSAFTYSSFTGTDWSCSAAAQVVTCTNHDTIAVNNSYATLTISVNVANNATPGMVTNTVNVSGGGAANNSGSDTVTIDPAPVLSVTKTHTGTFTQGSTAEWDITVNNTQANSTTEGTTNVSDTLATGYTISSITASGWNCGSSVGTGTLSCTSTQNVAGGASFNVIQMIVNVPTTSPTSVSNTASAWGGGDLTHTSAGTAAMGSDTATVIQVPASITINSGNNQSAFVGTAFAAPLVATVKDAAGAVIANYTPITFTAPGSGASGTFSNSTNTINGTANGSGQVSETFTANSTFGSYSVTVAAGTVSNTFSLTNTAYDLTISKAPVGVFSQGQQGAQYTITVTNAGNLATNGTITVTDTLPAGLTYVSGSAGWSCSAAAQVVNCTNAGPVAANNGTLTLTLTVNIAANASSSVTNSASVACACNPAEPNTGNNSTSIQTAVTQLPDLTVAKTHSPSTFTVNDASDQIPITVSNSGSAATSGTVTVTDTLPAGLTYGGFTGTGWSCMANGQTVTCTTTNAIAATNGSSMVTLNVGVASSTSSPLTNNVSVACTCSETSTTNNSNTDSIPVNQGVQITLDTSPTGLQISGDGGTTFFTAPHTFLWTPGSSHTIATTSPQSGGAGVQYVFTSWSDAGAISHSIMTPASATTYTASFKTQYLLTTAVSPGATEGSISPASGYFDAGSSVQVTATPNTGYAFTGFSGGLSGTTNPQNITMNAAATVTANFAPLPDLAITKTHPGGLAGHFSQGQMGAQYTINVGNNGPGATSGTVTVTDSIPPGLTLVAMSGTGWTCGAPNPSNVCTRTDPVGSGGLYPAITVTVNVSATAPSSVTNTATVSTTGDYSSMNNTAMDPTAINPITDVSNKVSIAQSGFARNRFTGVWSATLTLTNTSGGVINGPIQMVLTNLSSNATMTNNTGMRNGWPYITVSTGALSPGASASVIIQFTNPTNGYITYTPVTDSGVF